MATIAELIRPTKLLDKVAQKRWTAEDATKYVGSFRSVYMTHAADEQFRKEAASGGTTTALLAHLLTSGEIDGVLTVQTVVRDGRVDCDYVIAESVEALKACQGSKYQKVRFASQALPLLQTYKGRVAVVALPCDCTVLMRARQRDPGLDQKVKLVLALVCGHNSEPELTEFVTRKLGKGRGNLVDFKYRTGHWRGELTAIYEGGAVIKRPFNTFSDYRNLYICAERKCHACHDHYGYHCDISMGDIWSLHLRRDPIKHTGAIVRTDIGEKVFAAAVDAGAIKAKPESIYQILDGQSRTMPFHYNTSARSRVGRFLGIKIKDSVGEKVRPIDYLIAFIAMSNEKLSRSAIGRSFLFKIPRPILRAYLYFFKALELK